MKVVYVVGDTYLWDGIWHTEIIAKFPLQGNSMSKTEQEQIDKYIQDFPVDMYQNVRRMRARKPLPEGQVVVGGFCDD